MIARGKIQSIAKANLKNGYILTLELIKGSTGKQKSISNSNKTKSKSK